MDAIRGRTQEIADRMQELEDAHGPLDTESIQKLKDEKQKLKSLPLNHKLNGSNLTRWLNQLKRHKNYNKTSTKRVSAKGR